MRSPYCRKSPGSMLMSTSFNSNACSARTCSMTALASSPRGHRGWRKRVTPVMPRRGVEREVAWIRERLLEPGGAGDHRRVVGAERHLGDPETHTELVAERL